MTTEKQERWIFLLTCDKCSCNVRITFPHLAEVCTNRRCMGVKRFPSRLPVLTCDRERSGRHARRPWAGNSQRAISASRAGRRCPRSLEGTGSPQDRPWRERRHDPMKRPGAERRKGAPIVFALHLRWRSALPACLRHGPSAAGVGGVCPPLPSRSWPCLTRPSIPLSVERAEPPAAWTRGSSPRVTGKGATGVTHARRFPANPRASAIVLL